MCKSVVGAYFCDPLHLENNFDFIQPIVLEKEHQKGKQFSYKKKSKLLQLQLRNVKSY